MNRNWMLGGAAAAGIACITVGATNMHEPAPVVQGTIEGSITGWHVDIDGTVGLRLRVLDPRGQPRALWFVTAANRTVTTQFEDLVLQATLAVESTLEVSDRDQNVVVSYDTSQEASGKTLEQALKMVGVTRTW